ncbi:MAG: AraC family transcriptional regulator [Capsulimonadales bacterium]|nr:AraC family transcriptional regulator [Capsulimonadales bacterium]
MTPETDSRFSHTLLLRNDLSTPLGCLRLCGEIRNGGGVENFPAMRVYGRYAVVCVLRGRGRFVDRQGAKRKLRAGDAVLVFPEIAHRYGPEASETWDELYLTFDGPVFDLWRQTGLLNPAEPVHPIPTSDWPDRLRELVTNHASLTTAAGRLEQVNRFLVLLGALLRPGECEPAFPMRSDWLGRAQAALDIDLAAPTDLREVAATVDMSYETFRKRFRQATGITPARYRLQRRIAAACELLRYSPQTTNRQVAEMLGFADEFHFSRRFSQVMRLSPREFRRRAGEFCER